MNVPPDEKQVKDFAQGEQSAIAHEVTSDDGWEPLFDWRHVHPGNRGVNRQGRYELYEAPVGVRIRIEEAEKIGPIFRADQPWDGGGEMCPTRVWQDENGYHLLYTTHPRTEKYPGLGGQVHSCYAHSEDGYEWTRPALHQSEWEGSTENNILSQLISGTPFEDPLAPPEERFKAIGQVGGRFDADTGEPLDIAEAYERWTRQEYEGPDYKGPRVTMRHWVEGWSSADGIHWESMGELADMSSDGGSAAQYDPETESYFAFLRVGGTGRRATGLTRTKDFRSWPVADLVLSPDPQDDPEDSFYGTSYFRYPNNPKLHCAMVEIYHQVADCNDAQIAFSRNMTHWIRPERRAIIPNGEPGSDDSGGARPWGGLYILSDGNWAYMYRGHVGLHNYRESEPHIARPPGVLMIARWKPHRFVGIEADREGRMTIKALKRSRDELRLNFACKPGGSIVAELLRTETSRIHPDADPIPGFSFAESDLLTGDSLNAPMTWQGKSDLSEIGDTVAIRLKMFQAKLFAFSV
jgi:hypothetical protein